MRYQKEITYGTPVDLGLSPGEMVIPTVNFRCKDLKIKKGVTNMFFNKWKKRETDRIDHLERFIYGIDNRLTQLESALGVEKTSGFSFTTTNIRSIAGLREVADLILEYLGLKKIYIEETKGSYKLQKIKKKQQKK